MDIEDRQKAFAQPPPLTPGSEEAEQKFLQGHQYEVPSRMPRFYDSPVPLLTAWDPPSVRVALDNHSLGQFSQSALLLDEMLAYEALDTARSTRVHGVMSHPMELEPSPHASSRKQAIRARDMLRERWDEVMPDYVIDKLITYGEGMGFQAAQLVWTMDERRWWPQIQTWHAALTYYLTTTRSYMAITMEGPAPIVGGDGHWLLHAPHGLYRGWLHAKIRSCAYPWLAAMYALRDWMRFCEVHGLPIKKLKIPSYAYEKQKQDFERLMSNLGSESVVALPQNVDPKSGVGWDVELLEATSLSWQAFEGLLSRCDKRCAIAWLGQNLTTDVDAGSLAAANVHSHVKLEISKSDARLLAHTLNTQLIKKWAEYNFDDVTLAPVVSWRVQESEDLQAKSTAILTAAQAYTTLSQQGLKIDARRFFEPFGVSIEGVGKPTQPQAPGGGAPPAPPAPPPTGAARNSDPETADASDGVTVDQFDSGTELALGEVGHGARSGDEYIDDSTETGAKDLAQTISPAIKQILDALGEAESLSDVSRVLPTVDELETDGLDDVLERAVITGHLAGRYSIDQDHPVDDETTVSLSLDGWKEDDHPRSDDGKFGSGSGKKKDQNAPKAPLKPIKPVKAESYSSSMKHPQVQSSEKVMHEAAAKETEARTALDAAKKSGDESKIAKAEKAHEKAYKASKKAKAEHCRTVMEANGVVGARIPLEKAAHIADAMSHAGIDHLVSKISIEDPSIYQGMHGWYEKRSGRISLLGGQDKEHFGHELKEDGSHWGISNLAKTEADAVRSTMVHEAFHQIHQEKLRVKQPQLYREIEKHAESVISSNAPAASRYAKHDPLEYFAETMTAHHEHLEFLEKVDPKWFEFAEKVRSLIRERKLSLTELDQSTPGITKVPPPTKDTASAWYVIRPFILRAVDTPSTEGKKALAFAAMQAVKKSGASMIEAADLISGIFMYNSK